jgi:MFS family permease
MQPAVAVREIARPLSMVLAGVFAMLLGNGLIGTVAALRMKSQASSAAAGVVGAAFALGFVLGSFRCGGLVKRLRPMRCAALLAIAATMCSAGLLVVDSPAAWGILRFATGLCAAGIFLSVESWMGVRSSPAIRATVLAIYLMVCQASLGFGQVFAGLLDIAGTVPVFMGAGFFLLAIPLFFLAPEVTQEDSDSQSSIVWVPAAVVIALVAGCTTGVLLYLGPVYASEQGLASRDVGMFMAAIVFGGAFMQVPFGLLAKRWGRSTILANMAVALAVVALATLFVPATMPLMLASGAVMGAIAFALYPQAVSTAHESVSPELIVSSGAAVLLAYGAGCVFAPMATGFAMDRLGSSAVPLAVALACVGLWVMRLRPSWIASRIR